MKCPIFFAKIENEIVWDSAGQARVPCFRERKEFLLEYDERIIRLCEGIAELVKPVRIIIFNCKYKVTGELASFKLCVIVKDTECSKVEQKIYLNLDCEVPYDVLVYNYDHWNVLMEEDPYSFACRSIMNGGVVLYESE